MLATPGPLPSAGVEDRWAFEVKQDGQRAMVYLPGDGTILLRARSGTDIRAAYPELLPLAVAIGARSAVLDGEIVALDEQGRSDFERLQQRMGLVGSPAKAARMASRVPAHLMLFDLVHLDGRLLTGLPYAERRELLEGLGLAGPSWSTPAAITGHGAERVFCADNSAGRGITSRAHGSLTPGSYRAPP
ncbi:ATP-dependent DNA ligase, partial [Streptomyces fimicarius]